MNANKVKSSGFVSMLIPIVAVALGIVVGGATARAKFQEPLLRLAGHEAKAAVEMQKALEDAKPIVHLPAPTTYDFGVMARDEEQSHSFKIQNIGGGPLTLKVLDTTCKCTVGELGKNTVKPGEIADVTLTWQAKSYDREFRQSATIETNETGKHREVVFSVFGKVQQLALPDLPLVKFSRVSRSEPQSFFTKVYGFRDRDLTIVGHSFTDSETADFFDVKTEPLPSGEWEDSEAQSGVLVTVNIKSGLPIGPVRQIIVLETNKSDIAPIDVAVEMTVVSDISVLGRSNFNDETNMLSLGSVSAEQGSDSRLHLMVKGKYKEQVQFSVAEIDPESALEALIGDPVDINDTAADGTETLVARRFPLTIRVKKGSPNVRRLGSKQGELGRVRFNTNHPEIEHFDIKVQFAVQ